MSQDLFRKEALDAWRGGEEGGRVLTLTSPTLAAFLGGAAVTVAVLLAVMTSGQVTLRAEGRGALVVEPPAEPIRAAAEGVVVWDVPDGSPVNKGQVIGRVTHPVASAELASSRTRLGELDARIAALGPTASEAEQLALHTHQLELSDRVALLESRAEVTELLALTSGVLRVDVPAGEHVASGAPIASLEAADTSLVAHFELSEVDGAQLSERAAVRLLVDAWPVQDHGSVRAELIDIQRSSIPGAPLAARAAIQNVPEGVELQPGMGLTAEVETARIPLIGVLLPPLRPALTTPR